MIGAVRDIDPPYRPQLRRHRPIHRRRETQSKPSWPAIQEQNARIAYPRLNTLLKQQGR